MRGEKSVEMGRKPIDETGHIYGKWTVLRKDEQKNSCGEVCWICQCECGTIKSVSGKVLRRGKSTSCGLCNKKIIHPGDKYGKLLVIRQDGLDGTHKKWYCKCDCGNFVSVRGTHLTSGNTKSCGCSSNNKRYNLLNKKFGLLTVIEDMGNDSYGNSIWKCRCDCGNIKIIRGGNLVGGQILTCGCGKMSAGEIKIYNLLQKEHINFIQEYQPKDLNGKRFDFAILNSNNAIIRLIEFDGIQHFQEWELNKKDSLEERQKRDSIKNNWAKTKQIPLVRIPYWELNNITKELIFSNKYLI